MILNRRPVVFAAVAATAMSGLVAPARAAADAALVVAARPDELRTQDQQKRLGKTVSAALAACRDVSVAFDPGVYVDFRLTVDVRAQPAHCAPRLTLAPAGGGQPIFDGAQQPQFLGVVTTKSRFAGSMTGLTLKNYINGVALTGKDGPVADGASGFVIRGNSFVDLGGAGRDTRAKIKGWGAVVARGVGGVTVSGNRFSGLGNAVESELMHAVYLDGSSDNVIVENTFGAMDGAVVKLRSGANRNQITRNRFRYGGEALVQDWFCNSDVRKPGACAVNECPSYGNVISMNVIETGGQDQTRRGGGAAPVTNPYVSYRQVKGVRVLESYYDGMAPPRGCAPGGVRVKGVDDNEVRAR